MSREELNKELNKAIGQRVQEIRTRCNLSLEDFSVILDVTPDFLGLIERGERSLPIRHLVVLSTLFPVSQEYITTGVGKPPIRFFDTPILFLKQYFRRTS